jgi:hypothetical protein
MKNIFTSFLFLVCITGLNAQQVKFGGSGTYGSWARHMTTTMHCGNDPESWVRGKAVFEKASGLLTITVQLETDALHAGPKGQVSASLIDPRGRSLAVATTEIIGTGGKRPGKAAIRNFTSRVRIDTAIAHRVDSIYLQAGCKGSTFRVSNISLGTVNDAFKIFVKSQNYAKP